MSQETAPQPHILRSIRAAQAGVATNAVLAMAKITAGVVGSTYALIADGIESLADVASSLIVWGGVALGARPADENHPYGHGRAEALAALVVSGMMLAAAAFVAVEAISEIRTPHRFPARWTLIFLVGVVVVKALMAHRVSIISVESGSTAVAADASHHLSDAITSAFAFVGISAALLGRHFGGGPRWAAADDWAALASSLVIARNGSTMAFAALHDLMDRSPGEPVLAPLRAAALGVPGVCAIEKLAARRVGTGYRVAVHVQAAPELSLADAHALGGRVKHAMRNTGLRVDSVLVHMEPYHGEEPR